MLKKPWARAHLPKNTPTTRICTADS